MVTLQYMLYFGTVVFTQRATFANNFRPIKGRENKEIPDFAASASCTEHENFPADKILQGIEADSRDWPWLARLQIQTTSRRFGYTYQSTGTCGATIIANHFLVTAAHCCKGASGIQAIFADDNRDEISEKEFTVTMDLAKMRIHPNYTDTTDGSRFNFDICLLQSDEDLINYPGWSSDVRDSCAYNNDCTLVSCLALEGAQPSPGDACWIAGFGKTTVRGGMATKLQQSAVNLFSKEYCVAKAQKYYKKHLRDDELCAGNPDNNNDGKTDSGTDSCQGDSGGPLICDVNGRPTLTGIISWGRGCGRRGAPGVYSNITYVYDWMYDIVAPSLRALPDTTTITTTTTTTTTTSTTTSTTVSIMGRGLGDSCRPNAIYVLHSDFYLSYKSKAFEGRFEAIADINGQPAFQKKYYSLYLYMIWSPAKSVYQLTRSRSPISRSTFTPSSYSVYFESNELEYACIINSEMTWTLKRGRNTPATDMKVSTSPVEDNGDCGTMVNRDRYGSIDMYDKDTTYENKAECDWFFEPKCSTVQYKFTELDVESDEICKYDMVHIGSNRYSFSNDIVKFCTKGKNFSPEGYQKNGKKSLHATNTWFDHSIRAERGGGFPVAFVSDNSEAFHGFKFQWRCK